MLVGIKVYKHAQSPFDDVDLNYGSNHQGEEHHDDLEDRISLNDFLEEINSSKFLD